jgi:hypothetical protein
MLPDCNKVIRVAGMGVGRGRQSGRILGVLEGRKGKRIK